MARYRIRLSSLTATPYWLPAPLLLVLLAGATEADVRERDADLAEHLDGHQEASEEEHDAQELPKVEQLRRTEPVQRVGDGRDERADRDEDDEPDERPDHRLAPGEEAGDPCDDPVDPRRRPSQKPRERTRHLRHAK